MFSILFICGASPELNFYRLLKLTKLTQLGQIFCFKIPSLKDKIIWSEWTWKFIICKCIIKKCKDLINSKTKLSFSKKLKNSKCKDMAKETFCYQFIHIDPVWFSTNWNSDLVFSSCYRFIKSFNWHLIILIKNNQNHRCFFNHNVKMRKNKISPSLKNSDPFYQSYYKTL